MTGKKILVLGGGFGGVQAAIGARAALDSTHEVTIVDRSRVTHLCGMNPLLIVGDRETDKTGRSLGRLANRGIRFVEASIDSIKTADQTVSTSAGTLDYDYLVVALGAQYDDPFAYWARKLTSDPNIVLLSRNEQLVIANIFLSNHGDKGPGGARGTVKNLSEIGTKIVTGHGHSPAIQDGHTRTGTMTKLEAEYTSGPGAWLNTHCSIDNFGKRHLHTCIDGRFWL